MYIRGALWFHILVVLDSIITLRSSETWGSNKKRWMKRTQDILLCRDIGEAYCRSGQECPWFYDDKDEQCKAFIPNRKYLELFPARMIPDDALSPRRAVVRRKIVLYHNFFRTKVRPTASNMLAMSWHSGAARQAQRYAEECKYLIHNDPQEKVVTNLGACGQNLFVAAQKTPWFFATKNWFVEYQNFTYGYPKVDLKVVGHYTQMVWATSHKVGCGLAHCPGGKWGHFYNYVCHYCPGGNFDTITQYPYKVGEKCSDCPDHCVAGSLCTNKCPRRDVYSNCDELVKLASDFCEEGFCNATCNCGTKRIHKNYPWI